MLANIVPLSISVSIIQHEVLLQLFTASYTAAYHSVVIESTHGISSRQNVVFSFPFSYLCFRFLTFCMALFLSPSLSIHFSIPRSLAPRYSSPVPVHFFSGLPFWIFALNHANDGSNREKRLALHYTIIPLHIRNSLHCLINEMVDVNILHSSECRQLSCRWISVTISARMQYEQYPTLIAKTDVRCELTVWITEREIEKIGCRASEGKEIK